MSDASTAAVPEPTEVRFSIRAILIATIPLAILAAIVGPYVRSLDAAQQSRLAIVWGVWLAAIGVWVAYYARTRFRAERLAGSKLAELPPVSKYLPHTPNAAVVGSGIAKIALGLFLALPPTLAAIDLQAGGFFRVFYGVVSAYLVAFGIITIWWRQMVQLRDRGVLQGAKLILWEHIVRQSWTEGRQHVLTIEGLDQHGKDLIMRAVASEEQRQIVELLIEERLILRPSVPEGQDGDHRDPIVPTLQKTKIARSTPFAIYFRQLLHVFLFVFVYYAAVISGRTPSWLLPTFVIGAVGGSLFNRRRHRSARSAGKLLARLAARRDWYGISLSVFGLLMAYALVAEFGWQSRWVGYLTGIAFGLAAIYAFSCIMLAQLDLREGGLTLQKHSYWPWSQVKLVTWDRDGTGRLILGRRFNRVVAFVPPEQRMAVDAVLHEKLAANSSRTIQDGA